jgi:hypothetical protein
MEETGMLRENHRHALITYGLYISCLWGRPLKKRITTMLFFMKQYIFQHFFIRRIWQMNIGAFTIYPYLWTKSGETYNGLWAMCYMGNCVQLSGLDEMEGKWSVKIFTQSRIRAMVLNATFNIISVMS